jgi:hypothetical protein
MKAMVDLLASEHLNGPAILLWTGFAFLLAMAGGAVSGVKLAGKHLGNEVAAMIGAVIGPIGVVPGILVGLIVLAFI